MEVQVPSFICDIIINLETDCNPYSHCLTKSVARPAFWKKLKLPTRHETLQRRRQYVSNISEVSFQLQLQIDQYATSQRRIGETSYLSFNGTSLKSRIPVSIIQLQCNFNATYQWRIFETLIEASKRRLCGIISRFHCSVTNEFQSDVAAASQRGCKNVVVEELKSHK